MNAKHQFKYTYNETHLEEFSPLEVTFEMPAEISLTQMLYNFERYLQACGFVFDGKLDFVEDGYDLPEEEPEGGCMADWDKQFDDNLTTSSSCCLGSSETKNGCMPNTTAFFKAYNEKIENDKKLKEWNEGIAKLDNELKEQREIREKAYKSAEMCAEVAKNKWVHGLCNPPSPDWKKSS
jgi:hypothetical protein